MPKPNGGRRKISRRRVLQTMGASGAFLAGTGFSAKPVAAEEDINILSGDELTRLIKSSVHKSDIRNIMPQNFLDTVKRGVVSEGKNDYTTEVGDSGLPMVKFTPNHLDHPNNRSVTQGNKPFNLAQAEVGALAAKHPLDDNNELTVVVFLVGQDQLVVFHEYDKVVDNEKTKAQLWDIKKADDLEDTRLNLVGSSYNGSEPHVSPLADEFDPGNGGGGGDGVVDCGSCFDNPGEWTYWVYGSQECLDVSLNCAIGACSATCAACQFLPYPLNVGCFLGCLALYCPWALQDCCLEWDDTCPDCPTVG